MHGRMLAGKSTCADILEGEYGYLWANYTDYGKAIAARGLSAILGRDVPISEVRTRKNEPAMRDFLISTLRLYGFDQGAGIEALAAQFEKVPTMPVVFDNVRYLVQYEKLRAMGFRLVRLVISNAEQERRAKLHGMPIEKLHQLRADASEAPIPQQPDEITIHVDGKLPEAVVEEILDAAGHRFVSAA